MKIIINIKESFIFENEISFSYIIVRYFWSGIVISVDCIPTVEVVFIVTEIIFIVSYISYYSPYTL